MKWTKRRENTFNKLYEKHKDTIEQGLSILDEDLNRKAIFKLQIETIMEQTGDSVSKAVARELRTETFTPRVERMRNNAISGLKSDKYAYKEFLKLKGKRKFDPENLRFIGDNAYAYNLDEDYMIVISFSNSPKQVMVTRHKRRAYKGGMYGY